MTPGRQQLAYPATIASIAKIGASVAFLTGLFTVTDRFPQLLAGIIFVPAAGLTVVRHLRVLTLGSRMVASVEQIDIHMWRTYFLVPWVFRQQHTVPWSRIIDVTVDTFSVNGSSTSTVLLRWMGNRGRETISIPPQIFAESAQQIQQAILDRLVERERKPEGAVTSPPVRSRDGFDPPVVITSRPSPWFAMISGLVGALVIGIGYVTARETWFIWLTFSAIPFIFMLTSGWVFVEQRAVRRVELRRGGLGVGSSAHSLNVVPWEDISHAMVVITNGHAHSVRIKTRQEPELVLHGKYDKEFAEIRELIDPAPPAR